MVCRFCKKKLPDEASEVCPHCFAAWNPVDELKEDKRKTKTGEHNTVNGHE